MITPEIEEQQRKIIKRIRKSNKLIKQNQFKGILPFVKNCEEIDVVSAMGVFGKCLRTFAKNISLNHPDLANVFDGQLMDGSPFGNDAMDVIKLAINGESWGLSENVLSRSRNYIKENPNYKNIIDHIEHPSYNLNHVRFLKDYKDRNDCRNNNRGPHFCFFDDIQSFRDNQTKNFDDFWYGKFSYENDIKMAKNRVKHLLNNGLVSMSREIEKDIEKMETKSLSNQYMGFNRISFNEMSIIFANMIKCKTKKRFVYNNEKINLFIPNNTFKDHDEVEYVPVLYSYCDFCDVASSDIKSLIDFLESYPPLDNHALFDCYKIFVPTGRWPSYSEELLHGEIYSIQEEIDKELIKEGNIVGLLLGERDNSCYFISYFFVK